MDIINLLKEIKAINEKEIKEPGENFNVFDIIKVSYKELCHSSFIAELLNPKGTHGMKSLFLQIFLKTVGINDSCIDNLIVRTEKYIEGGRIDIALTNKNMEIFIENKIYAEDQPEQLIRYNKSNPDAIILYLNITPKSVHG